MIEELRLRDLGVIADATLPIGPGFTAITGETGAGKTMVVSGLGLLLGNRADSSTVRAGARQAAVDGVWLVPRDSAAAERVRDAGGDLEPLATSANNDVAANDGAAIDGAVELLMTRTVTAEGRSRASAGGRPVPAAVLVELAEHLVVVHGQSDQLRLRTPHAQRDALDRFGGAPVTQAVQAYRGALQRFSALEETLTTLVNDRDARRAEAAELGVQIADIERIAPQPGEDKVLSERSQRLANAEQLRIDAVTAHALLASEGDDAQGVPGVAVLVGEARRILERADDPVLTEIAESVADLGYRATDVSTALSGYLAELNDAAPQELADMEERRAVLAELVRAHGSVEQAISLLDTGSARLAEIDGDDERIEQLTKARDDASEELDAAASALTALRTQAASRLAEAVTAELRALALPDAHVVVEVLPAAPSREGRDEVSILLAPHPGATARSVAKSASGGELSRVMLAIEVVIAATDSVPTFVFDEIDAGIGGAAAIEVGRRLQVLAHTAQVIVVTHLAQVAAFANNHLGVVKASDGSVTASSVRVLSGAAREAEMARLLSGLDDSEAALTHARELLTLGESAVGAPERSAR